LTQNATLQDIQYKVEWAENEVRMLVVDIRTQSLYDQSGVYVNLRNVEGECLKDETVYACLVHILIAKQ